MAVPKKRRSKQKTKHRRFIWAKKALQNRAQILSTISLDLRNKPFDGFGKLGSVVKTNQAE